LGTQLNYKIAKTYNVLDELLSKYYKGKRELRNKNGEEINLKVFLKKLKLGS
jgi:hypothetical protein